MSAPRKKKRDGRRNNGGAPGCGRKKRVGPAPVCVSVRVAAEVAEAFRAGAECAGLSQPAYLAACAEARHAHVSTLAAAEAMVGRWIDQEREMRGMGQIRQADTLHAARREAQEVLCLVSQPKESTSQVVVSHAEID